MSRCRILLLAALLVAPNLVEADSVPRVIATIFPLADIVQQIGGDKITVITLLPAGASPHSFEPSPLQMREMSQARVVVRVGAGLDDWAEKLVAAAATPPQQLVVTDGIELLGAAASAEGKDDHHHSSGGDPHVWLDPLLVRDRIVPKILTALQQMLPAEAAGLQQRATAYAEQLTQLDATVRNSLSAIRSRKFIAFHSAWLYFAQRYQLEQMAAVEESPGKEPSARAIAQLVTRARAEQVYTMLIEPQFSPRLAEQIAREFGGKVTMTDPIGSHGLDGRGNYLDLIRFNAKAFAEALR